MMTIFDPPENETVTRGDLQTVEGLRYLMAVRGIGSKKATQIATRFRNLDSLRGATLRDLETWIGKGAASKNLEYDRAKKIEAVPLPKGVRAVCCFDSEWPEWLRSLSDSPAIIYVVGTTPDCSCIAVVGTRHPTEFGLRVVDKVVEEAASRGWGVVSGLALGIDTEGHNKALQYGAKTWAILGSGVDVPTPESNRDLARRIVESGGGLISEQVPGSLPNSHTLVSRNRLQVASSEIVLAAQSGIPSGTLHTVRFALEQGKRLVVPRPLGIWMDEPESAGNMALTNPDVFDPEILGAKGKLAESLLTRHPVADLVLKSSDIGEIWRFEPDVATNASPSKSISGVRLVVFDLDGTLANTRRLPTGIRTPYQLLEPYGWLDHQDWSFSDAVSRTPDDLLRRGYGVAIATRAPLDYASTLLHLLGVSTQLIRASCGATESAKANVLLEIALQYGLEPTEMLYVGDLEQDRLIATIANCQFVFAKDLLSGELSRRLPQWVPPVKNLMIQEPFGRATSESQAKLFKRDLPMTGLFAKLSKSFHQGIPDAEFHTSLLYDVTNNKIAKKKLVAGLSFLSLLTRPGTSNRNEWQVLLFKNVDFGAANCLVSDIAGIFQIDPRLVTRAEILIQDNDHYLRSISKLFPGGSVDVVRENCTVQLQAAFKYSFNAAEYGNYMRQAKNYSMSNSSGPHIQLGLLDFMADVVAGLVINLPSLSDDTVLIPIPSSQFSDVHVGEMSMRLADAVSKRTGLQLWPIVYKEDGDAEWNVGDPGDFFDLGFPYPANAILVEDQSTTGDSLVKASKALNKNGIAVRHAVAYSTSLPFANGQSVSHPSRECYFHDVAASVGMKCRCG